MTELSRDLTRTVLCVLFIGALIIGSFWVLQPFLPALIWAVMIVIATWPLMVGVERRLRVRRALAVLTMIFVLLLLFVIPFWMAIATVIEHAPALMRWARELGNVELDVAPQWVASIPFVGPRLAARLPQLHLDREVLAKVAPYVGQMLRWFVGQAGEVGLLFVHFLLTLLLAAVLYVRGEKAAQAVLSFARRLAGERGEDAARLSAQAIRAVALGVVVTALIQAVAGGLGLLIAGVPYAWLLTALMFLAGVLQVGSVPILLGTTIWLYWQGATGAGTGMLIWTVIVGSLDNFIRPMLIRRGANLPLLLVFAGVLGGLLAFGIVGLFVGPVLLAVSYTLLSAWVAEGVVRQEKKQEL